MIYLFNSAFNAQYLQNVFRTLFFPEGWINTYSYSYENQTININPADVNTFEKQRGKLVAITFVDRFSAQAYTYHPMRFGKLVDVSKKDGRLYFKVRLGNFFYPIDAIQNGAFMLQGLPTLPKLTNNDTTNQNDGTYAIIHSNLFANKEKFYHNEVAWNEIVNQVQNAQAFSGQHSVFLRIKFVKIQNKLIKWLGEQRFTIGLFDPMVRPTSNNNASHFNLLKSSAYRVEVQGRYPKQVGNSYFNLLMKTDDTIKFLDKPGIIKIGNEYINDNLSFTPRKYPEDDHDKLQFNIESNNVAIQPYGVSDEAIAFRLKDGVGFWSQISLALLLIAVGNITADLNLNSVPTLEQLKDLLSISKIVGVFANVIGLFWMFRLIGKKIF